MKLSNLARSLRTSRLAAGIAALLLLAPASLAQHVLHEWWGEWEEGLVHQPGTADGVGDVDGDGFSDIVLGIPHYSDPTVGDWCGVARVRSGRDGSVLHEFVGDVPYAIAGTQVCGPGDTDGDGVPDIAVLAGTDVAGAYKSFVWLYSGADGTLLHKIDLFGFKHGHGPYSPHGLRLGAAGDVDGDGSSDVIVGDGGDDTANDVNTGSVRVFSGVDGSVIWGFAGDAYGDDFGGAVDGAGDVNGDGFADLIVGATHAADHGIVRLFSGAHGTILHTIDGGAYFSDVHLFGHSVSGAGDVNGDGLDDVIVGEMRRAAVFSGADGALLHDFQDANNGFPSATGIGDANGDAVPDLAVGLMKGGDTGEVGKVRLFSGADGSELFASGGYSGPPGVYYGGVVAAAGDVDGDGRADVLAGGGTQMSYGGYVRVLLNLPALGTSYCGPAVPNSSGWRGEIHACGSDLASDNHTLATASGLPPDELGFFLASEKQGFIANPGGSQGNLCLAGNIARFSKQVLSTGDSGRFSLSIDLTSIPTAPPHAVMAGETWNFQAWFRDKNPTATSNFTDAVSITFQ